MISTTDEQGGTSYQYGQAGRLAAKTYPNNVSTHYAYDGAGKLSSLQIANPAHTLKTYAIDMNCMADGGLHFDLDISVLA